jgi:hypothetical protein
MIEAAQVPLENTAGQVLERKLNAEAVGSWAAVDRFEVLNFGLSAYGTAQDLLVWEEYASKFSPDHVFLYLSPLALTLTVERFQKANFTGAKGEELQVRPSYRIEGDDLIRVPPRDFERFVAAQRELIEAEYAGERSKKRYYSLLRPCFASMKDIGAALIGQPCKKEGAPVKRPSRRPRLSADDLDLSLRIIRELGRQVHAAGSQLVVIDDSRDPIRGELNPMPHLEQLCRRHGIGYIQFHAKLAAAQQEQVLRWPRDIHFNVAGNEVLAGVMYRSGWLRPLLAALRTTTCPRSRDDCEAGLCVRRKLASSFLVVVAAAS